MVPTFRALTNSDLPMIYQWIQRPHVAEWWHEPTSYAELERHYIIERSSTRAYIAMLEGEPIGFIQSYVAMDSGDGWWEEERDPGVRGIDQFLANAEQLGRGVGTGMVSAFVAQLFQDPAVTKVQTDPSPTNERAIRCYRRAGFVVEREVTTPDGPALLMCLRRAR
ncbi:MAG TPA: GNAT family N-acetyltransferase [Burkholderiales bacterium]|nr:GNAT family N-acetyltransferase [Burkholderiales bacterium]